jgi:hypothetical protein
MTAPAGDDLGSTPRVEATLNYLLPGAERPVSYAYPAPPGVPQQSGRVSPWLTPIVDARRLTEPPSLDRNGFELRSHRSALSDFSDEQAIRAVYYPETQTFLMRALGAVKVVVFDHTLRYGLPGHGEAGVREPVRRVHNDQTFVSGPRRVRDHLSPEKAEERLEHRFAIVNVWRPIARAVESSPLAVCDARSIEPEDLVPTDLVYRDKVGEVYAFAHSPRHRWFYFPLVRPDEVLLLKIYDSAIDGRARLTAHTAFDDPTSPADAPPRRSIELRTLVFFAPGA